MAHWGLSRQKQTNKQIFGRGIYLYHYIFQSNTRGSLYMYAVTLIGTAAP